MCVISTRYSHKATPIPPPKAIPTMPSMCSHVQSSLQLWQELPITRDNCSHFSSWIQGRYQQNHISRAHHQGCSLLTHSCELQWKYSGHTREYKVTLGKGWHNSRENNSLLWIEGTTTGWTPAFSVQEFIQLRSCEPKELLTPVFSSCGSPSEHHPVPLLPCPWCRYTEDCWRE